MRKLPDNLADLANCSSVCSYRSLYVSRDRSTHCGETGKEVLQSSPTVDFELSPVSTRALKCKNPPKSLIFWMRFGLGAPTVSHVVGATTFWSKRGRRSHWRKLLVWPIATFTATQRSRYWQLANLDVKRACPWATLVQSQDSSLYICQCILRHYDVTKMLLAILFYVDSW